MYYASSCSTNEMDEYEVSVHVHIVYKLVTMGMMMFGIGSYIRLYLYNALFHIVFLPVLFMCLYGVMTHNSERVKQLSYLSSSFIMGYNSSSLLSATALYDNSIIPFAFTMTFVLFIVFTLAAKFIKDEFAQILGQFFFGCLTTLVISGFVLLFTEKSNLLEIIYLTFGLFTFCGFISYDTYMMHQRIKQGHLNYYMHALDLLLDIVNIFIKLVKLIYHLKNKSNKD